MTHQAPLCSLVHGQASDGLHSLADLQRAKLFLRANTPVSLFYFEIENFYAFSALYGPELAEEILQEARASLKDIGAKELKCCGEQHLHQMEQGQFILLCGPACQAPEQLPDKAQAIRYKLRSRLQHPVTALIGQQLDVHAGVAALYCENGVEAETALYAGLCAAQRMARTGGSEPAAGSQDVGLRKEFRSIVDTPHIHTVYQPIVNLNTGRIDAWEALTRGPQGSFFQSPAVLFDYAEDANELFALERVCRESALRRFGERAPGQALFINIHPRTMVDLNFSAGNTLQVAEKCGLPPCDVVFEITERHAVQDFSLFYKTLEHYRSQGYRVAVDDVGAGYSGLMSIADIRPDYMKVDMSLVRGVDSDPVKRALLETLTTLAVKIDCRIVAEGVETATELSCLTDMGVHYAQGFYLARPAFPKPKRTAAVPARTFSIVLPHVPNTTNRGASLPVRELAAAATVIAPETPIGQAKALIKDEPHSAGLVVVIDKRPVGLLMGHRLNRLQGRHASLQDQRPVGRVMDPTPLIVDAATPVENVGRLAMSRPGESLYDHVVITHEGEVAGVATVQMILDYLASMQIQTAAGAEPLTGLPGMAISEQEILSRQKRNATFSTIRLDVENLKEFNAKFGFSQGDAIIALLARVAVWALHRHGDMGDFAGHYGGDNFVLLTHPRNARRVCKALHRVCKRTARTMCAQAQRENNAAAQEWNPDTAVVITLDGRRYCPGHCAAEQYSLL